MATFRPTVLTRVPLVLLDQARRMGADRRALLTAAGLAPQELKDPDVRIPSSKLWKLWQAVILQVPDPALGLKLVEPRRSPVQYGLLGYALNYSRTLRQALYRLSRYSRILSETIQVSVQDQGARTRVLLESDLQFEALRHPTDARLASIVATLNTLSGKPITPLEVELNYSRLRDISFHRRFFRAPLRFDRPRAALWFRRADLELPIVHADETLAGYLDQLAEEQLRKLGGSSLTERVGRALWAEFGDGTPSLQRVAERLGVSRRTLQRDLREEGKSFRAVLEDLRREMSKQLMHRRDLAVYEIAFLLGYADPGSYHRSFRRWHKTSPRTYRRAG
jgi:AraC-like DNA-binding protein